MPVIADVVFIYVLTCYTPKIVMFYAYLGMFFTRRGGDQPRSIICKNRSRVTSEFPVPPFQSYPNKITVQKGFDEH